MNARDAFANALIATRVASLYVEKVGMEHATPEAREKYLHDHPGADESKHTVKKDKGDEKGSPKPTEKAEKAFERFHNDAVYGKGSTEFFVNRMVDEAGGAEEALKAVQHALKDPSLSRGHYGDKERKVYERAEKLLLKSTGAPKSEPKAKPGKKRVKAVRDIMEKRNLKDEDADELESFVKRKPPTGQKLSDFQLMLKFLREAGPETKKRMKDMSISEFKAMYNSIMDEEGE